MATTRFALPDDFGDESSSDIAAHLNSISNAVAGGVGKITGYTPTQTGIPATTGLTLSGYWADLGPIYWVALFVQWGSTAPASVPTQLKVTLPVATFAQDFDLVGSWRDGTNGRRPLIGTTIEDTGSKLELRTLTQADGKYAAFNTAGIAAMGTNGRMNLSGILRKAS